MSMRKVRFVADEFYHIYNRGNSKQKIFHDDEDHLRFISLLYACNSTAPFSASHLLKGETPYACAREGQLIAIGAYCLMPNHFHILATQIADNGISIFMQKVCTAYVMYYNKKYARTGSLFEGKFKAQHAHTDRYLKYLFAYIHLNPLKLIDSEWKNKRQFTTKKYLDHLQQYNYSSYLDYMKVPRVQKKILNQAKFPDYFPWKRTFLREICDWIFLEH